MLAVRFIKISEGMEVETQTLYSETRLLLALSLHKYYDYDADNAFKAASELREAAQHAADAANTDPENTTIQDILGVLKTEQQQDQVSSIEKQISDLNSRFSPER